MDEPVAAVAVAAGATGATAMTGVDEWELEQLRRRELPLAKALPLSADSKTHNASLPHDAAESWEDDLCEKWSSMQVRLEVALRANPLDYENKCAPCTCICDSRSSSPCAICKPACTH